MTGRLTSLFIVLATIFCVGLGSTGAAFAEDLDPSAHAYFGCLFLEAQRDNKPISADGIIAAQGKCASEGLEYGDDIAKRAGSPGQSARHNSKKFIQGYLKKQVPAELIKAGVIK